jgi:galactoside 2-L-fucosyltransferase 1/2
MVFTSKKQLYFTVTCASLLSTVGIIIIMHLKCGNLPLHDDERWVAILLQCQLGNQLFMLASSHGLARARKARWCAVEGGWHSYAKDLEWPGAEPPEECPGLVWGIPLLMNTWYFSAFENVHNGGLYATYTAHVFVNASARRAYMDGYLQSFKYFDPTTPVPFRLKQTMHAQAWVAARNATVAIHVRRGDQLLRKSNKIPPLAYYRRALELLRELFQVQVHVAVVATDDPEWVGKQKIFEGMHVLSSNDPAFDMAVISQCRHKILNIGTFGWWGAFLTDPGHNRSNAVIYPVPQLKSGSDAGLTENDYFPSHWTRLDYSKPDPYLKKFNRNFTQKNSN